MGNTLTGLIPDIYAALDVVSRELVGFIPAVSLDASAEQVELNQTLRVPVAPGNSSAGNITPAMSLPAAADQSFAGSPTLTITKQRFAPFSWSGEEQKGVEKGPGFLTLQQGQIAQAIRALVNEMETDLAAGIYKGASRAWGTAGTTPFASDLSDPANIKKILDDNGAPQTDRSLVIDTTAGVKMRSLTQLTNVNQAGSNEGLRRGVLLPLHGMDIRESGQVQLVTKGTAATWSTDAAGYAKGATVLTIAGGTGAFNVGDVVTIAGDTANKYVVAGSDATHLTLNAPGLMQAIPAAAKAITVGGNFTANVAFSRNAVLLAARIPRSPMEGDLAIDRMVVTDPISGISFEFSIYPGYRMVVYHVSACWGLSVLKPEHMAILLG